ncbi:reverse transcriptase zinc-binding domain-containing protein [Tanacetum coccineum]
MNLLEVPIDSNSSAGWKNLLELREKIKQHVLCELGNGKTFSAWYDKWCQIGPLSRYITSRELYNVRLAKESSVADTIKNGNWIWPTEWYEKYPVLRQVQVPTLDEKGRDKIVWITNTRVTKKFSVSTVWKDISTTKPKVAWSSLVWFSQCVPKHSFVLWMAIQNKLMTQDKILMWKPNEVMRCELCKMRPDSHEHLFFKCPNSNKVWKAVQAYTNKRFSDSWKDVIEEMTNIANTNNIWSIVRRIVCGAVVYFIWQERNSRLFRKIRRDEEGIMEIIKETVKLKMMSFKVKESRSIREVERRWGIKLKRTSA